MVFWIDNRWRGEGGERVIGTAVGGSLETNVKVFFGRDSHSRRYAPLESKAYEENTKRKFHLVAAETRVHFHGHFRNKYSSHLSPTTRVGFDISASIVPSLLLY